MSQINKLVVLKYIWVMLNFHTVTFNPYRTNVENRVSS